MCVTYSQLVCARWCRALCAQCRASHVMRCSLRECQSPLATLTLMLLVTNRFFHRDRRNFVRFLDDSYRFFAVHVDICPNTLYTETPLAMC